MAGQILGKGFKGLLRQVIGDPIVGPEMTRRVREMSDDGWYDWDEYAEIVRRLDAKLSSRSLAALAFNAVYAEREVLAAAGVDTPEKAFADYAAVAGFYARNLEPAQTGRTVSCGPHYASLEVPDLIPRSLSEGYVRGFLAATGGNLERLTVTVLEGNGPTKLRFDLRWT